MQRLLFIITLLFSFQVFAEFTLIDNVNETTEKQKRLYNLLSADQCDELYETISFKNKVISNTEINYFKFIDFIELDPKKLQFSASFAEQAFKFSSNEVTSALFDFKSFDLTTLKIFRDIDALVKSDNSARVICSYDYGQSTQNKFPTLGVSINNALQLSQAISNDRINIYSDGSIEYLFLNHKYNLLKSDFNLRMFPFDRHNITINFKYNVGENVKFTPSKQFFDTWVTEDENNFNNITVPNFTIEKAKFKNINSNLNPQVRLEFNLLRIYNSFFYTTILPMLLIIICTWFIYLAQTEQSRFSTTTGSIFAIIAINLTASNSLPELSYNTLYDVFFLICISSVLFTVSALIITFKISQRGYDINKMHTSLIIIHPLLVIIIGSLIIANIYPDFLNMLFAILI